MRIALVGNRTNLGSDGKSFNTENHIALTLEDMGHDVTFIQENGIEPGTLPELVKGHHLFLWIRTWEGRVTLDDLQKIRELGIPSVNWHLDLFIGLKRGESLDIDPRWRCDYTFTVDGDAWSQVIFKQHGINHIYSPPGVYKAECQLIEKERELDIVFVGGGVDYSHPEYPYRQQLLNWLRDTYGERFHKYGYPEKTVRGKELNELYANTKVVIGDTLCKNFTHQKYFSDRVMETLGRGAFIIHPYIRGIDELFVDGKEVVTYEYGNFDQLKYLIDYYIKNQSERESILKAGHERTIKDHTYHNRMQTMLDIITNGTGLPTHPVPSLGGKL